MRVARGSSARRGWGAIPSPAWSEVATAARCGEARKGRIRPSLAWIWRGGGGCGSAGPARCGGRRRLERRWHGWPMQGRQAPPTGGSAPRSLSARRWWQPRRASVVRRCTSSPCVWWVVFLGGQASVAFGVDGGNRMPPRG